MTTAEKTWKELDELAQDRSNADIMNFLFFLLFSASLICLMPPQSPSFPDLEMKNNKRPRVRPITTLSVTLNNDLKHVPGEKLRRGDKKRSSRSCAVRRPYKRAAIDDDDDDEI
ncbi:hypothetical protein ElyMa_001302300 [Elysia marginata]|uniref:Uncharacterized protein n=1 Tax=Elysia marginata TaxID=1093978 RepID=A0AAV4IH38_9GAST|nr:hypothetical protein ElyMa_001302300 [Elysia marginata]